MSERSLPIRHFFVRLVIYGKCITEQPPTGSFLYEPFRAIAITIINKILFFRIL